MARRRCRKILRNRVAEVAIPSKVLLAVEGIKWPLLTRNKRLVNA